MAQYFDDHDSSDVGAARDEDEEMEGKKKAMSALMDMLQTKDQSNYSEGGEETLGEQDSFDKGISAQLDRKAKSKKGKGGGGGGMGGMDLGSLTSMLG